MESHKALLEDISIVQLSKDILLKEGIGALSQAYEDELLNGIPEFENLPLKLVAVLEIADIIETIRTEIDTDIWCEVVIEPLLEQESLSYQMQPMVMFQPRRKRLYFWGKALPSECKGHLKNQQTSTLTQSDHRNFIRNQEYVDHYGNVDLTFQHWFTIVCAQKADVVLDPIIIPNDGVSNVQFTFAEFLYKLLEKITPTRLFQISDARLEGGDFFNETVLGVSNGNLEFNAGLSWHRVVSTSSLYDTDTRHELAKLAMKATGSSGDRTALFDNDGENKSKLSLYNFESVGDLFFGFCDDLLFKPQVELPILDDIQLHVTFRKGTGLHTPNSADNRNGTVGWAMTTRWLFINPFTAYLGAGPVRGVYSYPLQDVTDYAPRTTWLGKVTGAQPVTTEESGILAVGANVGTAIDDFAPDIEGSGLVTFGGSRIGAKDVDFTTMFGFVGQSRDNDDKFADDPRGPEILILDNDDTWVYARSIAIIPSVGGVISSTSYAYLRALQLGFLWSNGSAIVEFDSVGIGMEPSDLRDFDIDDFGDFPMYRWMVLNPGLLIKGRNAGEFVLFSTKRTPGEIELGESHHRFIMIGSISDTSPLITMPPPDIHDDPTIDPPPEILGAEPICGAYDLTFTVAVNETCIEKTEILFDGILKQTGTGVNPDTSGTNFIGATITIDFCNQIPGPHTFQVKVYTCDGRVISDMWLFTSSDTCCSTGGTPPLPHGKIMVGDSGDLAAAVDMGGDASIADDGTVTIAADAITTPKIIDDAVTTPKIADGAVTTAKIGPGVATESYADSAAVTAAAAALSSAESYSDAGDAATLAAAASYADAGLAGKLGTGLTNGKILIGNGSNVATAQTPTGDVTIDNAGVTAIGANKVTTTTIANDAVTLPKISDIATLTVLGNNTGGSTSPLELTVAQLKTMLGYSVGYTRTDVDMNSNGSAAVNDDVVDTLIAVSSKPAIPQYTRVMISGDFPVNAYVAEWMVIVAIGGRNTDAANSRTINWRFTLNGTDIGSTDDSRAIGANGYYTFAGSFMASAIVAGDTIGVKLWGSAINTLDYRAVTIYVMPRIISPPSGSMLTYVSGTGFARSGQLNGAIAGATYLTSAAPAFTPTFGDRVIGGGTLFGTTITANNPLTFGSRHGVYAFNALTSNNNYASNTLSSLIMQAVPLSALLRYFTVYTPSIT
jgi:hypothetical protein